MVCCAALGLTVGVATATAGGGNSAAAKACQKGGWNNWVRADHTAFKNEGHCVSYAAKGGVLTSPKSIDQRLCESLGGGYAGPDTHSATCGHATTCRMPTAPSSDSQRKGHLAARKG